MLVSFPKFWERHDYLVAVNIAKKKEKKSLLYGKKNHFEFYFYHPDKSDVAKRRYILFIQLVLS